MSSPSSTGMPSRASLTITSNRAGSTSTTHPVSTPEPAAGRRGMGVRPSSAPPGLEPHLLGGRLLPVEEGPEDLSHLVEAVLLAVEAGHPGTAGPVAERQPPRQSRHGFDLVQLHGLDRLHGWGALEPPRRHGPDRRLDLQVGPAERAHGSVLRHEGGVIPPSD